ncbi:hypothetical protein A2U01_0050949, partial [Trifolium medium]|nr:hypothetical protein [Trifolium medium]
DKAHMEDLERRLEQRFASMEARMEAEHAKILANAETIKKIYNMLASLIQKVNPKIEKPFDVGGIGLNTEEKQDIEANLNGGVSDGNVFNHN